MLTRAFLAAWVLGAAALGVGCPAQEKCELDADCDGQVCARNGECLAASQVREVQVRWTIRGVAASAASCAPIEPLGLQFQATAKDALKYEPVACAAGLFTIDKLPARMTQVRMDGVGVRAIEAIGANGQVQVDLR